VNVLSFRALWTKAILKNATEGYAWDNIWDLVTSLLCACVGKVKSESNGPDE